MDFLRSVEIYVFLFIRFEGNKVYLLKVGLNILLVYCYMNDDFRVCGSGGWMLVIKIDGNNVCYFI